MEGGEACPAGRGARWAWAGVGVMALVAVGLGVGLRAAPRAGWSRRLPDGTWLRLEAVTYGTQHHFEPGLIPWSRVRGLLPFLPWTPVVDDVAPDPALYCWLSRREPGGRGLLGFEWWSAYAALDEHGCVFPGKGKRMVTVGPKSGGWNWAGGGDRLPPATGGGARFGLAVFTAFPRRQARLRLRLCGDGGRPVAEFSVPNPRPGPHPPWNPQRLPITRREGDLAVTLTRLTLRAIPSGSPNLPDPVIVAEPTFRYTQGGRPTTAWNPSDLTLSDATGNTCNLSAVGLCYHESAWKLKGRFFRGAGARFAPGEVWTMRGVRVPRPGAVLLMSGTTRLQGARLGLRAIAGPGTVAYTKGVPRALRPLPPGQARCAPGISISSTALYHVAVRVRSLGNEQRLLLRAVDDRGRALPGRGWASSGGEWFLGMAIPSDARTVDLSLMLQKARHAEFLVRPPALPRN
jgi:hypothetical protein